MKAQVGSSDLVTVRELLELSGMTELQEDPRRTAAERRRSEQLCRALGVIANELSDVSLALEVIGEAGPTTFSGVAVQLLLFEGQVQLSISSEMEQALLVSWGEGATGSPRVRFAFLVARISARQSFPSRYGIRLANVAEAQPLAWEGSFCFEVALTPSGGERRRAICRIDYDAEVARRIDWYAARADDERAQQQLGRVKRILRGRQYEG